MSRSTFLMLAASVALALTIVIVSSQSSDGSVAVQGTPALWTAQAGGGQQNYETFYLDQPNQIVFMNGPTFVICAVNNLSTGTLLRRLLRTPTNVWIWGSRELYNAVRNDDFSAAAHTVSFPGPEVDTRRVIRGELYFTDTKGIKFTCEAGFQEVSNQGQNSSSTGREANNRGQSSSSSSHTTCSEAECGPAPGMPNSLCPDGKSYSGPSGRCLRNTKGQCGWEILECPSGGTSGGQSSSFQPYTCGNRVCESKEGYRESAFGCDPTPQYPNICDGHVLCQDCYGQNR
jgi:hypothetical protein